VSPDAPDWGEEYANTAGGSFRYWARRPDGLSKMVFGINVSGEKLGSAEPGELDVWIRTDKLSEVSGLAEVLIKGRLTKISAPLSAVKMNFILRLRSIRDAERLVSELTAIVTERDQAAVGQVA